MDKPGSLSPARRFAFEVLLRVEDGAYASVLLASRAEGLKPVDRGLAHELVLGVLRRQLWLDRLIEFYSKRTIKELDTAVLIILRLGIYQLRFLSRVPASAAVNESVNLVKFARLRSAVGLVNAVLRRATREPNVDPVSLVDGPLEQLAVRTSHPSWLLERWIAAFGIDEAEAFAEANNQPPPIALRIVSPNKNEARVVEALQNSGAELTRSTLTPGAWRATGNRSLLWELAALGQVYIQDEASQLVGSAVGARDGERVLDLCAAPGSKTTQMADSGGSGGSIIACDLHSHRLQTISTLSKLHRLPNIELVALDGLNPLPFAESSFDRVLVDAPCSGTGTLRRNPEIRWRISPADIADLAQRQRQLLENAASAVKPGGRLVYSTCSVEPDENEAVAASFLENNKDFAMVPVLEQGSQARPLRTWPHRDDTDGFFLCVFERKSAT